MIPGAVPPRAAALARALATEAGAWPAWWRALPPARRLGPAAAIAAYWAALLGLGGLRGDHLAMGALLAALYYGGARMEAARRFLLPFLATMIVYDSQRFFADAIRGPIHVREPYELDKALFGIRSGAELLTPNEWWQRHTHWALDLVAGLAYLVFFAAYVAQAAYLALRAPSKTRRMGWAFFGLNVVGYSTYYWYAASPPWYVALYGLGPARTDVPPNPAGCARFDALLGTHFFAGLYGRSADVHGAIPSLHVAYPCLALCYAWRAGRLRAVSAAYLGVMAFAAVYLDHHYVVDVLCGLLYAAGAAAVAEAVPEIAPRAEAPGEGAARLERDARASELQ